MRVLARLIYFCSRPAELHSGAGLRPINQTVRKIATIVWTSYDHEEWHPHNNGGVPETEHHLTGLHCQEPLFTLLVHLFFPRSKVLEVLKLCDIGQDIQPPPSPSPEPCRGWLFAQADLDRSEPYYSPPPASNPTEELAVLSFIRVRCIRDSGQLKSPDEITHLLAILKKWAKFTVVACAYRRTCSPIHPAMGLKMYASTPLHRL